MPQDAAPLIRSSACPHDCPSTCALEIEVLDAQTIGRVRGAKDNDYTAGVICAKVARYAERAHHPDRLTQPHKRVGPKGSGQFAPCSWDEALDLTAAGIQTAIDRHGPEGFWPYFYAGTMGLLQRDGIHRLRHAGGYSRQVETICSATAGAGFLAGHGARIGADPREMAESDLIVIWGTNPVNTQVNVMTHAARARKARGAKIAVVDIYRNGTVEQADVALCLKPGTDAALACAVMHVLFRDGYADREYLATYADRPAEFEAHLADKTPAWAAAITGLTVDEIEAFARLIGETPRSFFRLGYGFTRSRNGAVSMHAASCIPVVTGAWKHVGGGSFFNNGDTFGLKTTLIEGSDVLDPSVRMIDMSQIGRALTGDAAALRHGPPVDAIFIQNMNPVVVAPEQTLVKQGFAREDLFIAVHEQFMTETAQLADVVLPATMFTEHDDIYVGGGHPYLLAGPKLVDAPGQCRSNHDVVRALAERLGIADRHEGFRLDAVPLLDRVLKSSGYEGWDALVDARWVDCRKSFEETHFINGFRFPDGKFRFAPKWNEIQFRNDRVVGPTGDIPEFPDHWDVIENVDAQHPFRLATSPARNYLNSSFTETKTSRTREGEPRIFIHPSDLSELGIADGEAVTVGNARGEIKLAASAFDGVQTGVVIIESIPPNHAFADGVGLNTLTGAGEVAPVGGAAFHDVHVWIRRGATA